MKPIYEKLLRFREEGFAVKTLRSNTYDCPWHFHGECELILVQQGAGHRVVGDNVSPIVPGDLVLIGANLPHIYQNDPPTRQRTRSLRGVLIQFEESWWSDLFKMPAFDGVQRMLRRAALGLHFTGASRDAVADAMARIVKMKGLPRIALFLTILDLLSNSRNCSQIASPGFTATSSPHDERRVNTIWRFINDNLGRSLNLPAAARLVHMSEGAFSRFFRAHLGKTFPELVNELRIGRACRLLAETEENITEIALSCGYRNLSNFHRQFARLKGCTPLAFRRRLVRKVSDFE